MLKDLNKRWEAARRIPEGALRLCGTIGVIASVTAIWATFASPWYPLGYTTGKWRFWVGLITIISAGLGLVIYAISQRARRGKTDEELIIEGGAAPVAAGGGEGGAA